MKNLAILILISFPILCNAQTIHFEDRTSPYYLYHNHENVVTILPGPGMDLNEMTFTCVHCEMKRDMTTSDEHFVYNLTPEKYLREAYLQIHDKEGNLLKQEDFRVSNPPAIQVYLGSKGDGETLDKSNIKLWAGYPDEVTLKAQCEIESWEIRIDELIFADKGQELTEEAMQAILTAQEPQTIRINCSVKDKVRGINILINLELKVG